MEFSSLGKSRLSIYIHNENTVSSFLFSFASEKSIQFTCHYKSRNVQYCQHFSHLLLTANTVLKYLLVSKIKKLEHNEKRYKNFCIN